MIFVIKSIIFLLDFIRICVNSYIPFFRNRVLAGNLNVDVTTSMCPSGNLTDIPLSSLFIFVLKNKVMGIS